MPPLPAPPASNTQSYRQAAKQVGEVDAPAGIWSLQQNSVIRKQFQTIDIITKHMIMLFKFENPHRDILKEISEVKAV